jgi:hypothetical protein
VLKKRFENTKEVIRSRESKQEHAIQWPKEPRIETRTYNTMAKKKMTNGQFMIYKTLHRQLKIEQNI